MGGIAERLGSLAEDIVGGITSKFSELKDSFTSAISSLGSKIENALSRLNNGILDGIKEIFIPDEDFISERWNSIKARFSFADSISNTASAIVRFFETTAFDEPPKVYINFDFAESKYDYGGQAYCLDMSWYARYKPVVDAFLSAWLWLCFIWRVYTRLPAIINGAAGDFQVVNSAYESRDYIKWSLSQRRGGKK